MSIVRNPRNAIDNVRLKALSTGLDLNGDEFQIIAGSSVVTDPGNAMDKAWTQEIEDRMSKREEAYTVVASGENFSGAAGTLIVDMALGPIFQPGPYQIIFFSQVETTTPLVIRIGSAATGRRLFGFNSPFAINSLSIPLDNLIDQILPTSRRCL